MDPRQYCEAAEGDLARAGQLLLSPTPAALEECLQALTRVSETLEALAAGTSRGWDPSVRLAMGRIHAGARALGLRIELGAKLVRGWKQLRCGEGYTRRGLPAFAEHEAGHHMEA
jgi:hypothetical protein